MKIWALTDSRPGNYNQVLALADKLNLSYERKNIEYNKFAKLPNFINFLDTVDHPKSSNITQDFPDLVISAGRKSARVALWIKQKNPATKIVQIMWPECYIDQFDIIITPTHDNKSEKKYPNLINTLGALTSKSMESLEGFRDKFKETFDKLQQPYIGVLIGGSTSKYKFGVEDAKNLMERANQLTKENGGSFAISTSRRTGREVVDQVKSMLPATSYLYDFESSDENPYNGILLYSDIIIVTSDSIGMITESCLLGKPVFIFETDRNVSSKHKAFIDEVYKRGFALPFTSEGIARLKEFKPKILDETSIAARKVAEVLK